MKTVTAWVVDAKKWTRARVLWRQGRTMSDMSIRDAKDFGIFTDFSVFLPEWRDAEKNLASKSK